MRLVITCKCGQQFATKSRFIGRQVNCWKCGESMTIRAPHAPPPAEPLPPPIQFAQPSGIRVRCACGWAFAAPWVHQGHSVPCPGCGGLTQVPLQDPLGLGYRAADLQPIDTLHPLAQQRDSSHRWAILACCSAALLPIALLVSTAIYNFALTSEPRPLPAPLTQTAPARDSEAPADWSAQPPLTAKR